MGKQRSNALGPLAGLGLAALLGACALSSDGDGGPVRFSFSSPGVTLPESAAPASIEVVLTTTLPELLVDASVEVADAGTGTATAGADYAEFPARTVTFPAGSTSGASVLVTLDPLDDSLVDGGAESVRLVLQDPVEGALGGTRLFTATLTDIHSAELAFASAGTKTVDEDGSQPVALELECGAGVTLGVPVSVRVSDLRTGSAVPPGDYSSFSARTVTFPAGTADGAVQTVSVQVVDDAAVEGDETVDLGLSAPVGCTLGALDTHVLTIDDDDVGGLAAFLASAGPTGTENPLVQDEVLGLGSQGVGSGPNAGTLVRVANGGGQAMDLGAPRVAGTHPNDFAVDLESSSFAGTDPASALAELDAPAPLSAAAGGGPGVALVLDPAAIARLAPLAAVTLHDLVLPDLGPVSLELRRRPLPLRADARLVLDGREVEGGARTLLGDLQLWSGSVAGLPGSRVFLALTPRSAQGFLELPQNADRFVHVLADGAGRVRLVREGELVALGLVPPVTVCAGERFVPGRIEPAQAPADPDAPTTSALTLAECRLAIETDFQLFQEFGSSAALTSYVTQLVAAASERYATDVQCTLAIAYLGIHTTSNDGWSTQETSGADAGDLLDEFKAAWDAGWPAEADLAHFLSGDALNGGIAYVNSLCSPAFGYGVSSQINGSIDWASWDGRAAGFTWDFVVVAHEIGHNFGSRHTHDYCPPLDRCYSNCSGATFCSRGTLMSYCHVNCGGLGNIDLVFHPVCANIMRERVNASCLEEAALLPGDYVQYRVRFNPLTETGMRSAALEFPHDATNVAQPFRVQLRATAD